MKAEFVVASLGGKVTLFARDPATRRPLAIEARDVSFAPAMADDLATDLKRCAEQARLGKDGFFDDEDRWQGFGR